ncbi:hypothetical protein Tco_0287008 [Tanacetum coccineum]
MQLSFVPYTSHAKLKKTEVEEHPRISSISNKTKSVTACNDSLNSRTSNANAVCATCGKCVFNSNHDACVSKFLNDVNARTKKPNVVPISTRKTKSQATKSVATPHKKTIVQLILFIVDSGCTKHIGHVIDCYAILLRKLGYRSFLAMINLHQFLAMGDLVQAKHLSIKEKLLTIRYIETDLRIQYPFKRNQPHQPNMSSGSTSPAPLKHGYASRLFYLTSTTSLAFKEEIYVIWFFYQPEGTDFLNKNTIMPFFKEKELSTNIYSSTPAQNGVVEDETALAR